jgi:hypothetical protein
MDSDFTIRLDITFYEADLIKEGLRSLLKQRYKQHSQLGSEHNDYVLDRIKNIQNLYEKVEGLQAKFPRTK